MATINVSKPQMKKGKCVKLSMCSFSREKEQGNPGCLRVGVVHASHKYPSSVHRGQSTAVETNDLVWDVWMKPVSS